METKQSFRKLSSYKKTQREVAIKKGCLAELDAATTLTEARKIVYGEKQKNRAKRK